MAISEEIGDLKQDVGQVQGELKGINQTLTRLENKMDENQRVNIAAHLRQDTAIAELTAKLAYKSGEYQYKEKRTINLRTGIWTFVGATIGAIGHWLANMGSH